MKSNNSVTPIEETETKEAFKSDKNDIEMSVKDASKSNDDKEVEKADQSKEAEERDSWTGKLDFFLSALSYSVGLGAIWRFPYLCYDNGGGAFLIPFFLFLLFVGIPLMYMELAVGQFMNRGPVMSWVMVPLFKGVGISMNMINNYVNIYYIMIMGYSLYYLFLSLRTKLPWEKCDPKWSSPNCVDDFRPSVFNFTNCIDLDDPYKYLKCDYDGKCFLNATLDSGEYPTCDYENKTALNLVGYWNPAYPSQDYWNKVILQKTDTIDETGYLVWELVVSVIIAWAICFLCLFRGVKLSGKIVYFTALFPYLVLLILGIRGWTLDGAEIGIEFYIKPDLSKLAESKVWKDAAVQVFFTLSLSYGGLIALSSYNKFNHNILRDTLILSVSNFLTCLLAGFVVFAYMGALSKATGLTMDKVAQSGQGLVYVVFPYAVTTIPVAPLWSVMFFIMMLALGIGTQMASVETLTTSLEDFFPYLKSTPLIKAATLAIICVIYFLIDLLLCTQAGTYWIELFDSYSANWAILMIAFFECMSIAWVYSIRRFKLDLSAMIPKGNPKMFKFFNYAFIWWTICWTVLTPALLLALMIFTWTSSSRIQTGGYLFPVWTDILGNLLSASSLLGIFFYAGYEAYKLYKNGLPLSRLVRPDPAWRPLDDQNAELVKDVYAKSRRTNWLGF